MSVIGFTGTRKGMTSAQAAGVRHELVVAGATWLHHGDCLGADAQAHSIAVDLGIETEIHPPIGNSARAFCVGTITRRTEPYADRNRNIVSATALLIAASVEMQEEQRSGTWSTVRYARRMGKPVVIIWPDGLVSRDGNVRSLAPLASAEDAPWA